MEPRCPHKSRITPISPRHAARIVARPALRVGEGEEQHAAGPVGGGALPAQRVERHAIEAGSLLVGGQPDSTLARGARVLDGLRGVPGITCGDEVVGELREVRVAVIRVQRLECLADFTVQAETTRATDLPVQAVTDQDVGEAQPGGGSRNLRQHVPP